MKRLLLITIAAVLPFTNALALGGDANTFKLPADRYASVAWNACLNEGGKPVETKIYVVCSGGKYDGYIYASDVTAEYPFLIVDGSSCVHEGGQVVSSKKYNMCDGGSFDGWIADPSK